MAGSILVYGSNSKSRKRKIREITGISTFDETPDIKIIKPLEKKSSIGIAQIRDGINFLRERPFSKPMKMLVILDGDLMTTQAQNALLKTLEEPPEYALVVIEAKNEKSLLATVVSRCKKTFVNVVSEEIRNLDTSFQDILDMSINDRLTWVKDLSKEDSQSLIEMLEIWVEQGRWALKTASNNREIAYNIKEMINIKDDLENTNVNKHLALEKLVLSLK